MPSRIQRELALLVTGKDVSASRVLGNVDRRVSSLERHMGKASRNMAANLERGIVLGAAATAGAIGYMVNQAIDWESAFAGVRKTVEGTPEQLDAIAAGLRAMSKEMPVSATELANIAANAGALGIRREDILSFTKTVAMLGATTNVTTADASTALGQLQNVLGLTGSDFDAFAAALVDLGNKGASTESQILEIARRAGGSAALIGVAKDATLGWAAAAANLGINEELAGTSLQRFFQTTLSTVGEGGKKLQTLADTAGMTGAQFRKAFAKDATGALTSFIKGLGKLPKKERLKVVQDVFGKGAGLTRLILGLADSVDRNLVPALDDSTTAWADGTAASVEYQKRLETTAAQLDIFKNNINDAAITIGTALLPLLNDLAKEGVAWLTDHQAEITQFGQDLAANLRTAVDWARKLDWKAIGDTLKAGASVAKGIVDAFLNAPPWVQQFLAAGFVANKFTGGVIGDVLGESAKGLIKGVLNTNVGVMNVKAGVVNGAGGGVPGAASGAGAAGTAAGGAGLMSVLIGAASVTAIGYAVTDAMLVEIPKLLGADRGHDTAPVTVKGSQGQSLGTLSGAQAGYLRSIPGLDNLLQKAGANVEATLRVRDELRNPAEVLAGLSELGIDLDALKAKQDASLRVFASGYQATAASARTAGIVTSVAQAVAAQRIVSAIGANRPVVNVSTAVSVTGNSVTRVNNHTATVGRALASRDGGNDSHPGGGGP